MITLTLIVPLYNEERRIEKFVISLNAFKPPKEVVIDRVVFVSDGSTDKTLEKIYQNHMNYPCTILSYKQNRGRGYALRYAMTAATGDYALWLDVDLSTPLAQLTKFLPAMKNNVPVIIASRVKRGAHVSLPQPWYRTLLGNGFRKLTQFVLQLPIEDFNCGFKAFSKEAYTTLFPLTRMNGWGNDSETLFLAKKYHFKINEIPTKWKHDPDSKVKVIRDIIISFLELLMIRVFDSLGTYERENRSSVLPSLQSKLAYEQTK